MPYKTAKQDATLKNLLNGTQRSMVWWLSPNPGQPYSEIYVHVDAGHFRIEPDGDCHPCGADEYQAEWGRAYRARLSFIEEFHRLSKEDFEKLMEKKE